MFRRTNDTFDFYCLEFMDSGKRVGFVPAPFAKILSRLIDEGHILRLKSCRVSDLEKKYLSPTFSMKWKSSSSVLKGAKYKIFFMKEFFHATETNSVVFSSIR